MSSVGFVRDKTLPGTTDGHLDNVCHFRHALALDERRVKFLPEYVFGTEGPTEENLARTTCDVKEVWFNGSHSDMWADCFLVHRSILRYAL